MHDVLTTRLEPLADLCRTHHVQRMSAFGSAVRDDFEPSTSDVDLLVAFQPDIENYARNYFDFLFALDSLFGLEVDLLTEGSIRNPVLHNAIEKDKVLLYAAQSALLSDRHR